MRLQKARVTNYRSIVDSGEFDVEKIKTILVGPNEAGKTAILQALQHINPPPGVPKLDPLRDYPRGQYNDITTKKVDPASTDVVTAHFALEDHDKAALPAAFRGCTYVVGRRLNNSPWHRLEGAPPVPTYGTLAKHLTRLCAHVEARAVGQTSGSVSPTNLLAEATNGWTVMTEISVENAKVIKGWLDKILPSVDESNAAEEARYDEIVLATRVSEELQRALDILWKRLPVFVLFNNYFRVRPLIQLDHLAQRVEQKILDDDEYDYGNQCLLKLLGFTARELSNLGRATEPTTTSTDALQQYRDQLDKRSYQLNAASVRLTSEIRSVWRPQQGRAEADKLRVQADGQYLKVVVEDDLGVEIELHQRSEGFQWLVSFFVVFFAEAVDKHENAILLLDEPGLSLHGLKQREFRGTLTRLAEKNQAIYSTHSPFLVGPDELDIVRVVEMLDRKAGTKIHGTVASGDPAALLPLQEALGYDLAQSLFTQKRNLVLEGLTDYWYLDATAQLLRESEVARLNEKISLIPAASAGKVVYYATILYAQNLKVAALLDSDNAGDLAARQENLVHALGNKGILRTKDVYAGSVTKPEIEDLLRDTLISIAKEKLGIDVASTAAAHAHRPLVDIFADASKDFSKYKLAKAYLRWTRDHTAKDLTATEVSHFTAMIEKINRALS